MKKLNLNLVIDAIMLIVMMAIIGMGLLVKYTLLTGQEKWEKFGENLELTLFGLDRHEWGQVHFILGIGLFGLLVLHVLLHWKMIVSIYKNLIKQQILRIVFALGLLILSIGLMSFSFFVKPNVEKPDYNYKNRRSEIQNKINQIENKESEKNESQTSTQHTQDSHHNTPSDIEVKGSMTLGEVSRKYKVPVEHLKNELNISASTPDNERLGQLRRSKGFTMSEVEEIIYAYQKENNNDKKN